MASLWISDQWQEVNSLFSSTTVSLEVEEMCPPESTMSKRIHCERDLNLNLPLPRQLGVATVGTINKAFDSKQTMQARNSFVKDDIFPSQAYRHRRAGSLLHPKSKYQIYSTSQASPRDKTEACK